MCLRQAPLDQTTTSSLSVGVVISFHSSSNAIVDPHLDLTAPYASAPKTSRIGISLPSAAPLCVNTSMITLHPLTTSKLRNTLHHCGDTRGVPSDNPES